jgi:GntR family histidine utilization transcriptional repressor
VQARKRISRGQAAPRPRVEGEAPLHQRIRADIEARILSGEWQPGHRIPYEHELMAAYGCARMTVSKAIAALAEAGLIERRRRAGSFVRRPAGQSAMLSIPDIKAEIEGRGEPYRYAILSRTRRPAEARDAERIDRPEGAPLLAVTCVHYAADAPFAYEDRLISLDGVPEAAEEDFATEPPGTWLLHHEPWHEAEHRITARNADAAMARLLGIPTGAACIVVDRRTWRSQQVLTAVRLWYAGDRQELVARFTPAGTGR